MNVQKYEYCITDGEGTLIDYGIGHGGSFELREKVIDAVSDGAYFEAEPCADDCETGQ